MLWIPPCEHHKQMAGLLFQMGCDTINSKLEKPRCFSHKFLFFSSQVQVHVSGIAHLWLDLEFGTHKLLPGRQKLIKEETSFAKMRCGGKLKILLTSMKEGRYHQKSICLVELRRYINQIHPISGSISVVTGHSSCDFLGQEKSHWRRGFPVGGICWWVKLVNVFGY